MRERIAVVGVPADGSPPSSRAAAAVARADLIVGGRRHLAAVAPSGARTLALDADIDAALDAIAAEPGTVCVLASGDPGFFGILRPLAARFGPERLEVHAAVSSVAAAFARLGIPWDDAEVVSAHGRPVESAVAVAARATKAAVLVSPELPPETLGKALLAAGSGARRVAVCSSLGTGQESVVLTDLAGLASGSWDPLSVVVLVTDDPERSDPTGVAETAALAWGLPDSRFGHRSGMITKSEVRAVVLSKLSLPGRGVLWDIGAGSGSVAVEAARLAPGLRVYAVERDRDDVGRARRNADEHAVNVEVVEGEAPDALDGLPGPDRVFIGGGGLDVLDAAMGRLRPGGRAVATYAAVDRAVRAAERLGHLVQVSAARGERLPDGGIRLVGQNPVFVVWGPDE